MGEGDSFREEVCRALGLEDDVDPDDLLHYVRTLRLEHETRKLTEEDESRVLGVFGSVEKELRSLRLYLWENQGRIPVAPEPPAERRRQEPEREVVVKHPVLYCPSCIEPIDDGVIRHKAGCKLAGVVALPESKVLYTWRPKHSVSRQISDWKKEKERLEGRVEQAKDDVREHKKILSMIQDACPHKHLRKIQGSLVGHKWVKCRDCGAGLDSGEDCFEGRPTERINTGN